MGDQSHNQIINFVMDTLILLQLVWDNFGLLRIVTLLCTLQPGRSLEKI